MEPKYVYLIIGLVLLVTLALVAVLRYQKSKVSLKGPFFDINIEGEGQPRPEQPQQAMQEKTPSARTKIGGKVIDSTVLTKAPRGSAETDIGEDVEKSDIRSES